MLSVVIPMAGAGVRFRTAGYNMPKPLIDVAGIPMIERVLDNIGKPSVPVRHVLLINADHLEQFAGYFRKQLVAKLTRLGFAEPIFVPVVELTDGQASTCLLAASHIDNGQPLLIANCDQLIDWTPYDFVARAQRDRLDGLILTYTSDNPNNSYVLLTASGLVAQTVEKVVVGPLATCGLYFWTQGRDFVRAAQEMVAVDDRVKTSRGSEFYVCPAYNYLIGRGGRVGIEHVANHYPLGTPEDLNAYLATQRESS